MKPMPLLLACVSPMAGPQVQILGRPIKVMTEGLGPMDQVVILGDGKTILEFYGPDCTHPVDFSQYDFVQAKKISGNSPIHVWLEY